MGNEIKPIKSTEILPTDVVVGNLMSDLRQIIDEARIHVAAKVNYELTLMYWHIGERINRDVLGNERAAYGKQIVPQVATQLQMWYGNKGFEERNVRRMMQFAQNFPDLKIVTPLVTKLSWSHFLIIMSIKDSLQQEFYLTMAATELWSKRDLQEYKGQMELYLRWLEQNEMEPGEETPLGLLLCTEGSEEQIELLQLDKSGIKVAQYMTELPPRDLLIQQIQKSLEVAKAKWGNEIKEDEV